MNKLSLINYQPSMKYAGLLSILLIIIISCSKKKDVATIEKYTCPMHPQVVQDKFGTCPICGMDLVLASTLAASDSSIVLSESQTKLANITVAAATYDDVALTTIVTGKIVIDEDETEIASARVAGRLERIFFKETGRQVLKGEALYEIYSEQLQALQQEYLLALRQFEELKLPRYETFVKSAEKKLILLGMTKTQVEQLAREKKLNPKVTYLSQVSGIVEQIDAVEGQYVSEGANLFRIEKLDQLWVEGELYPEESTSIRMGDQARVRVEGFTNSIMGKVVFLSPEFKKGTQINMMRVLIQNPKREFIPGMQANVFVTKPGKKSIAVPVDAVIREKNSSHVWIAEDSVYRLRWIKTGAENSEYIEVLEGVEENENVVVTGGYLLYSEWVLKKDRSNQ